MLGFSRQSDPATLLRKRGTPVLLRGGTRLYRAGDASDAVYLLISGRVRVLLEDSDGARTVREAGPDEILGAVGVYTGSVRATTAIAIRDTQLLKLPSDEFSDLMRRNREALWAFGQLCLNNVNRRHGALQARSLRSNVRTVAVIPAHEGLPVSAFAAALQKSLTAMGSCCRLDAAAIDSQLGVGRSATPVDDEAAHLELMDWLAACEQDHAHVIYQAEQPDDAPWTRRCLRQADRVLVLARADQAARIPPVLAALDQDLAPAATELVFLTGDGHAAALTPWTWRERCAAEFHHWVDLTAANPCDRLARMLTGRALCLVLGGGGARGAAHLGLLLEMEARGLAVDVVGGTSVGAFIAALVAMGYSPQEIGEQLRHFFIDNNFFNDYTVPRVSLIGGRKAKRELETLFGDTRIEMLQRAFFCVSTNLTRGEPQVHWRGSLAHWLLASSAVPGVVPPVAYQGDLLVDGAVLNNVPVDLMQALGRGAVIASDVTAEEKLDIADPAEPGGKRAQTNIFKILFRSATLLSPEERAARRRAADLYLRMPVAGVGIFDWELSDQLIQDARAYAGPALDAWLESTAQDSSRSSAA